MNIIYYIRRVFLFIVVIITAISLNFFLPRWTGQDPVQQKIVQLEIESGGGGGEKSELIERKVWTKEGKSGISIRKIITLKTSKSEIWDGWPEWIVFYSDYSSGRKSPLDKKLRTALSIEEANKIETNIIEANIKKGWDLKD